MAQELRTAFRLPRPEPVRKSECSWSARGATNPAGRATIDGNCRPGDTDVLSQPMFRFTIRDVLWLTVVIALVAAMAQQQRLHSAAMSRQQIIRAIEEEKSQQVRFLVERGQQSPDPVERMYAARAAELDVRISNVKASQK